MTSRDEFKKTVVDSVAKRAAYICSNPDCRKLTIAPSQEDSSKYIYIAKAAHIKAAAPGGPRYDSTMTSEQRSSIENALFLCSNCADMIDKNNGLDFSPEVLNSWKATHERWARENLNKKIDSDQKITVIQNTTFKINSANQQGGITAGIVNVNKSRTIENTFNILNALVRQINIFKQKNIKVTATMGDGESIRYAEMVRDFLRQNGFTVEEFISQVVWATSMPPISYNDKNGEISVNVGSNV